MAWVGGSHTIDNRTGSLSQQTGRQAGHLDTNVKIDAKRHFCGYSSSPGKTAWSCALFRKNGMGEPEGAPATSMREPSSTAPANNGNLWLRPGPCYTRERHKR